MVRMGIIKNSTNKKAEEDVEKREPSCAVGGNVHWCSHHGEVWKFLKKLKIEFPYDPAVPLLSICPDKSYNSRRY